MKTKKRMLTKTCPEREVWEETRVKEKSRQLEAQKKKRRLKKKRRRMRMLTVMTMMATATMMKMKKLKRWWMMKTKKKGSKTLVPMMTTTTRMKVKETMKQKGKTKKSSRPPQQMADHLNSIAMMAMRMTRADRHWLTFERRPLLHLCASASCWPCLHIQAVRRWRAAFGVLKPRTSEKRAGLLAGWVSWHSELVVSLLAARNRRECGPAKTVQRPRQAQWNEPRSLTEDGEDSCQGWRE